MNDEREMLDSDPPETDVVVRQYGLLAPQNWGPDVDEELNRMNRFWNTLVEIEQRTREKYLAILGESEALAEVQAEIEALQAERLAQIEERNKRRAAVRSKSKADTGEQQARIKEINAALKPLYTQSKALMKAAREEKKAALKGLEMERRAEVKAARQNSGCFWCNYNAVLESYSVARVKAMKDGGALRFRRFDGTGRLTNQIQGGASAEEILSGKNTQVQLELLAPLGGRRGRQGGYKGLLTIRAFFGRDETGKRFSRDVRFPIVMHRPFPPGAIIKSVTVTVRQDNPTVIRGAVAGDNGERLETGRKRYEVSFVCRHPKADAPASGGEAVGINLGWKQVQGGLRVATAVSTTGETEHLVVPDSVVQGYAHIEELRSRTDLAANALQVALKEATATMPLWSKDGEVPVEGLSERDHRLLSAIKRSAKTPSKAMDVLAWRLKAVPDMPFVADLATALEAWRAERKKDVLEMDGLRRHLQGRRKNTYREFAKRWADKAQVAVLDASRYKEMSRVKRPDGEDTELAAPARHQRVIAAPYELKLALQQAFKKAGGTVEQYSGTINHCTHCGSTDIKGEVAMLCHGCKAVFDVDVNAAMNLLASVTKPPEQRQAKAG